MGYANMVTAVLLLVAILDPVTSADPPTNLQTVTRLTKPLPLRPGEVTNSYHKIPIPAGPIAIREFAADVVERDPDGTIVPVPLRDAYLHHHVVFSEHEAHQHMKRWWSPMKPSNANRGVGFGAGTESRGTPQRFYHPYAFTTVKGEDELIANVHIINTRGMDREEAHHCLECPCTSSDVFETNGTLLQSVAARRKRWGRCNTELEMEGNTACSPNTYSGGLVCCEDGEYCLDKYDRNLTTFDDEAAGGPISTFYLRYSLIFAKATEENKPLSLAACCDASGNKTEPGNIEYDIPKLCDEEDSLENKDCVHELSTVQMLHGTTSMPFGILSSDDDERFVDVVYMVGHLHRGGIDITASDGVTGELICKSLPTYGTGDDIGNERGYINGMSTCVFDPPRRMKTTHPILVTSSYDAREAHTGVMSLFYIAIADVEDGNEAGNRRVGRFPVILQWAGAAAVIACAAVVASRHTTHVRRMDYEMVPTSAL